MATTFIWALPHITQAEEWQGGGLGIKSCIADGRSHCLFPSLIVLIFQASNEHQQRVHRNDWQTLGFFLYRDQCHIVDVKLILLRQICQPNEWVGLLHFYRVPRLILTSSKGISIHHTANHRKTRSRGPNLFFTDSFEQGKTVCQ